MLDPCTWFLRASYLRPSTIHTCFFPSQKKRDDGRGKLVGPTAPTSFGSTPPMPPFGIGSNAPLSCTPLHHSGSGCDREGEREGEEDRRAARGTGTGIDASEMPPVRLDTWWSFARRGIQRGVRREHVQASVREMNLQGQDWDTVVIRKKAPSGSAAKDKDAINAVRDRGNHRRRRRRRDGGRWTWHRIRKERWKTWMNGRKRGTKRRGC